MGAARRLSRSELSHLFFWSKDKTDTETAIEFIYGLGRRGSAQSRLRVAAKGRNPAQKAQRDRQLEDAKTRAQPILEAVARHHGLEPADLIRRFPLKNERDALWEAMWLLHRVLNMSYPAVAFCVERSCHTSAMDGVTKVEARIVERPTLRDELIAIAQASPARRLRSVG